MSALDDLRSARAAIEGPGLGTDLLEAVDPVAITQALKGAIRDALAVPGPAGDPAVIAGQARACAKTAARYGQAADDIHRTAGGHLPSIWQGAVADMAARAITALGSEVGELQGPLEKAAEALTQWADDLTQAQDRDRAGIARLNDALAMADRDSLVSQVLDRNSPARQLAADGASVRIAAAEQAEEQAKQISAALRKLAGQAGADKIAPPGNDTLTSAQLAGLKGPNGALLTPDQIELAGRRLEAMSPSGQAAFDRMLADAKSPLEAGYLWQALAAGHGQGDLRSFASVIGPHGADQAWLMSHLSPDLSSDSYQGQSFSQGDVNDCVSASTVIAQAKMDPAYMLSLTTGRGPAAPNPAGDGQGDGGAAFKQRLQAEYLGQYSDGQAADGTVSTDAYNTAGVGAKGQTLLANQDLGRATGSRYQRQDLASSGARADTLGQINQAVSSGKPVPVSVTNGSEGHQMMIIGSSGGKLQIYNPWGHTTWVTDGQFVNGQLGALTDTSVNPAAPEGGLPTPNAVELPQ